MHKNTLKIH